MMVMVMIVMVEMVEMVVILVTVVIGGDGGDIWRQDLSFSETGGDYERCLPVLVDLADTVDDFVNFFHNFDNLETLILIILTAWSWSLYFPKVPFTNLFSLLPYNKVSIVMKLMMWGHPFDIIARLREVLNQGKIIMVIAYLIFVIFFTLAKFLENKI